MNAEPRDRWRHLEELWDRVYTTPEPERSALLDRVTRTDPQLAGELEALLADAAPAEAFFERFAPVVDAGAIDAVKQRLFDELHERLADRYLLERELGEGGMAIVFLARDLRHDRPVALKVLKPELAASLGVDRFLREIEIAAGLHHPHVLPVFDSGEVGDFVYYVMPYEAGRSLRERLAREGALPLEDAIRILRDIVDALAYAHEQGIVHCDVKPENVLLSARHAAVADFGVARAVFQATRDPTRTPGIVVGTPRYMAPEQAVGEGTIDQRADIYAIGVLAYEMLAGSPPFADEGATAIMAAHLTRRPEPLGAVRPAVPAALAELVMRCLEKQPADRWQRTEDLLSRIEDLRAFDEAVPVARSVRRRASRAASLAAVAVVAALLWMVGRPQGPAPTVEEGTIVVLPIVNREASADAALADGMTVELNAKLARVGLRPIASSSVFAYRDRHGNVTGIADSLRVRYVLEGDWHRMGGSLRVRVLLSDARNRSTLWSRTFDREFRDVFAIQDEIARAVAREVGVQLGARAARLPGVRTDHPAAHELYLLATDPRVFRTDSASRVALEQFRQAIALDSGFAAGFAGLAQMYIRVEPADDPEMSLPARLALSERLVRRALELDDSLAQAYQTLGNLRLRQYRFDEAERHFTLANRLDPNTALAREALVRLYVFTGRFDDALEEGLLGVEFDPLSPAAYAELARAYMVNGRCDLARAELARLAGLDPPVGRAVAIAAQCDILDGDWTAALARLGGDPPLRPWEAQPSAYASLAGFVLGSSGRRDEAVRILDHFLAAAARTEGHAADVATLHTGLGDVDQAFHWLDRAVDDQSLRWEIREPMFTDLHRDPRFTLLLRRIGIEG